MLETMTPTEKSIWILIPAYNEAVAIEPVIRNLKTHGYDHILVVDDGTGSIAAKAQPPKPA